MSTGEHAAKPGRRRVRATGLWFIALIASLVAIGTAALAGSAGAKGLPSNCQVSGVKVFCVYFYSGSQATFRVPVGVRSVHVDAVGGTGANNEHSDGFGGYGGWITANVSVRSGSTLYVDVGGNGHGDNGGLSGGTPSGGGGGPAIGIGGGGGGASTVQTCSASASSCTGRYFGKHDPRLVVAGGGGGAGGDDGCSGGSAGGGFGPAATKISCSYGGGGGSGTGGTGQWVTCEPPSLDGGGGGATPTAPGTAGNSDTGDPGQSGSGPMGGNGYVGSPATTSGFGGGGGGGYYGGGGGGATNNCDTYGFGGGAGSSHARGTHLRYGNDMTATPQVIISYKLVELEGLRVSPHSASVGVQRKVHFTLNTAATVKFTVSTASGHRLRGKIVKRGRKGLNKFVWNGQIGGRMLGAGSYVLTGSPPGAPAKAKFKITG